MSNEAVTLSAVSPLTKRTPAHRARLLLATALVFSLSAQDRRIDGSKTPELIPDDFAYRSLFDQLTGLGSLRSRESFLTRSALSEQDAKLVFQSADRYFEAKKAARASQQLGLAPGQRPTAAQREAIGQAFLEADEVLTTAIRTLQFDLSPAGKQQLQAFVLNHIKRSMSLSIGGPDPARPPTAATPSAAPLPPSGPVPNKPSPFGGASSKAEETALFGAASHALQIVHTTDEDASITLELWNASTKAIEITRVAVCAPSLHQLSGLGIQGGSKYDAAPGATLQMWISKRGFPSCDPLTPRVAAVIFEDGTAVGLPVVVHDIKLAYLGRIAETERILRLFDAAGDVPSIPALLEKIGVGPSGSWEDVRAAYQGILSPEDASAVRLTTWDDERSLFGGFSQVRLSTRNRLEDLASEPDPAAEWNRIRAEFRDRLAAARRYREKVGANIYP